MSRHHLASYLKLQCWRWFACLPFVKAPAGSDDVQSVPSNPQLLTQYEETLPRCLSCQLSAVVLSHHSVVLLCFTVHAICKATSTDEAFTAHTPMHFHANIVASAVYITHCTHALSCMCNITYTVTHPEIFIPCALSADHHEGARSCGSVTDSG